MITIYTQPGCARCRRLKRWLKDANIKYHDEHLYGLLMDDDRFLELLAQLEDPSILGDLDLDRVSAYSTADASSLSNTADSSAENKGSSGADLQTWMRAYQQNPSSLYRPLVVAQPGDSAEAARSIRHYFSFPENATCSSCPMIPVCQSLRKEGDAALFIALGPLKESEPQEAAETADN